MKTGFLLLILLALSAACSATGDTCEVISPRQQAVLKDLAAIAAISDNPATAIWPGYSPFFAPLEIQFPDKKTILVNPPQAPAGYSLLADKCPGLLPEAYEKIIFVGREEKVLPKALNYVTANGSKFFAILDYGDQPVPEFTGFAVHEIFHTYQAKKFQRPELKFSDNIDAEGLAGEYNERLVLARALYAAGPGWVEEFISRREDRYRKQGERLINMEARQELDEGTAAYVQARSIAALMQGSHPAGELARDQVAATLIPKMLPYSKVPFYGSGAAICLLLDKYGDDWKNEIEKGSTLFEALKKRAGAGSGKRHYFGDFTTLAKSEVIWNDAKRETVLNDFYDPSKVRLVIEFETKAKDSVASSGSTSSSGDYLLVNNGTLMHLVYVDFHLSSVFNLIVQESSFFFSYKRVPAAGTGPWHIRYELPLLEPERLRITLDGKLLKSRSAEIPFKTIRLKAWNADLKLNVPGVFSMHGKVITVRTGNLD